MNGMRAALMSCLRASSSSATPRIQALIGLASGTVMSSWLDDMIMAFKDRYISLGLDRPPRDGPAQARNRRFRPTTHLESDPNVGRSTRMVLLGARSARAWDLLPNG